MSEVLMQDMNVMEMEALTGGGSWGDFLTGLGCGMTLVAAGAAAISPEPFSKAGLLAYSGVVVSCTSYFL